MSAACLLCGAGPLRPAPGYADFHRAASDCRPWGPGGALAVCGSCGGVQKIADRDFLEECDRIYAGYALYAHGGGAEPLAFDQASGRGTSRSEAVIRAADRAVGLPETGRLLDAGCGTGAFLRAFGRLRPGWDLVGQDRNPAHREAVLALPGVRDFVAPGQEDGRGPFDLISLIHCLEHVTDPAGLLRRLSGLLAPGGLLLVQVPDRRTNPFDLLVADHVLHFDEAALSGLACRCGLTAVPCDRAAAKELTLLARPGGSAGSCAPAPAPGPEAALRWLGRVRAAALAAAPRGLFGASIASSWLFQELQGRVDFFVDEDTNRAGSTFLGRPVYAPSQVPAGAKVFTPLPPEVARGLARRLAQAPFDLILPPETGPSEDGCP